MNETRLPSVALRLLGLGTALCLLFGCSPSEPVSGEVSEPVGTPVEVTTVTHGDLAAQARLSGKVAAAREVSILAPLSAKVTAVYVRVGDKVENGTDADIVTGNALPLSSIPTGTFIHNVELYPGKGAQLARAGGCMAQLMGKEGD